MIIYIAKNKITGKAYIGQTIGSLVRRINQHANSNRQDYFHKALRKYGKENFEWEVLEKAADIEHLNQLEAAYIAKYNTLIPYGYNLATGGSNSKHNERTRKRLSDLAKLQWSNEESKSKILNAILESPKAIEARKQNGLNRKGVVHTEASKEKMSIAQKKKVMSNEAKQKISETLKARFRANKKGVEDETGKV